MNHDEDNMDPLRSPSHGRNQKNTTKEGDFSIFTKKSKFFQEKVSMDNPK
jgi:hypothetical protein